MDRDGFSVCLCGCGKTIPKINKMGKVAQFVHGHNRKGISPTKEHREKIGKPQQGQLNHSWKGGRRLDNQGYILVYNPEHSKRDNNTILEHRLVYEQYYNCRLLDTTVIHHKNGIKSDNRIQNLEPLIQSKHTSIHHPKVGLRSCLWCWSSETYIDKHGIPYWHRFEDGYICQKCKDYLKNRICI